MTDTFNTVETQASYGIGFQMGQQLQSNPFEGLAIDAVVAGLKDAFGGQAPLADNSTDCATGKAYQSTHHCH